MAENRIPLCDLKDLPQGCGRGFSVKTCFGYEDIFVVHKQGRLFAYRNSCPHTGVPLEWVPDQFLDADGSFIECATHGALFTIEDGRCVSGPCAGDRLQPVRLAVENDVIYWLAG